MAAACVATLLAAVVLPAQPASAFWSELCKSQPRTPFMIDPKIYLVDGPNKGVCQSKVSAIVVDASLERYIATVGEWRIVSQGTTTRNDVDWAWADAFLDCGGMGKEVQFRVTGEVRAIYGYGSSSRHSATGSTGILNCTELMKDIQP